MKLTLLALLIIIKKTNMKKSIMIFLFAMAILGTKAQKTTHGDCRTHIEAYYKSGRYVVYVTNYTGDCNGYTISFPDKFRMSVRNIPKGKTRRYKHIATFVHGSIIVMPNKQVPQTCPFGSVQVNL